MIKLPGRCILIDDGQLRMVEKAVNDDVRYLVLVWNDGDFSNVSYDGKNGGERRDSDFLLLEKILVKQEK